MAIIKLRDINNDYLEGFLEEKSVPLETNDTGNCHLDDTNSCHLDDNLSEISNHLDDKNPVTLMTNYHLDDTQKCHHGEKNRVTLMTDGSVKIHLGDSKNCHLDDSSTEKIHHGETRGKYQASWRKQKKDVLYVELPKGSKATLQAVARDKGVSVSSLVRDALSIYLD